MLRSRFDEYYEPFAEACNCITNMTSKGAYDKLFFFFLATMSIVILILCFVLTAKLLSTLLVVKKTKPTT